MGLELETGVSEGGRDPLSFQWGMGLLEKAPEFKEDLRNSHSSGLGRHASLRLPGKCSVLCLHEVPGVGPYLTPLIVHSLTRLPFTNAALKEEAICPTVYPSSLWGVHTTSVGRTQTLCLAWEVTEIFLCNWLALWVWWVQFIFHCLLIWGWGRQVFCSSLVFPCSQKG